MNLLKQQIEQIYLTAIHFKESASTVASKILEAIGEDESRLTRSGRQSRARWVYLKLIADELNDRGWTHDVPELEIYVRYNKDILYHLIWQPVRRELFPEKKRQLNSLEFTQLVDHVMDLVSMHFDIHISFPNYEDFIQQLEAENNTNI